MVDPIERFLLGNSRVQDVLLQGEGREARLWVVPRRPVRAEALEALLRERFGAETPRVTLLDALPPAPEAVLSQTPGTEAFEPLDELLPESLLPREGGAADTPAHAATTTGAGSARPSLLEGGPRATPPDAPRVLGEVLRRAVERHPERTLTFIGTQGQRETLRYADLWRQALQLQGGLQALGVKPGERVVLLLEQPGDYIRAFWACVLGGAVLVPMPWPPSLEPSHPGMARLVSTAERLGRPLVLTEAHATAALEALGLRTASLSSLERTHPGLPVALAPEATALLSFTSGSTGRPKGVVLSHDNLLAMCDAVIAGGYYTPEDSGLSWMPLDHVAGVAFAHLTAVRAGTSHTLVARDFVLADVLRWLDLLSELGATQSWAPNFAYGLVAERLERGERRAWTLSGVRVLVCAGEPLVVETLQRFLTPLAPQGLRQDAICPMWGMAETSSAFTAMRGVRTLSGDTCVALGPPVAGAALRIVDDEGNVVSEGRVGHLQVRGASVMRGYLEDDALNAQSFTPEGWFRTGDLALVREGLMAIAGRQKEVLIVNGANVYPHDIEAVVEQVPGVLPSFAVACPTRAAGARTDELVVFFVPTPGAPPLGELLRSIREHVGRTLGLQVSHLVPLAEHQVPKTGLGKRGRAELRRRFEAGELSAERREAERLLGGPSTLPRCLAVPRWVPRSQLPAGEVAPSGALVVLAEPGFASALRERLADRQVVEVAPGSGEALARALEALAAQGRHVGDVVVAAALGGGHLERGVLERALTPLLEVVRTLAPRAHATPVRLWAVAPSPEGALSAGAARLLAPGLLWSAEVEVPGLEARVVWVPAEVDAAARCVAEELGGLRAAREVSWREGERFERAFTPWVPSRLEAPRRLVREGLYLITGALGGVGQAWARYLRRALGARLVLVGRRGRDATAEALEQELGAAEYVSVDVTAPVRLREVLRQAEARHGRPVEGAFHFAATVEPLPLERHTPRSLVEGAAAQVLGAVALAEAFRERPEALLVFASSLMGTLGAGQYASYCAAAGFVDRFAEALSAEGRRAVAVSLSSLRGTGLARGLKGSAPGYRMLEPPQALASLVLAVESQAAHVLVGVEGAALPWRRVGLGAGVVLDEAAFAEVGALGGPFEEIVAEAFREVLGADRVGSASEFFSLGGSSLQATRVVARIHERTGLRLRELALFEHPTVARLATHLRQSVDLDQLDVSQLSDEQVSLLLGALHSP